MGSAAVQLAPWDEAEQQQTPPWEEAQKAQPKSPYPPGTDPAAQPFSDQDAARLTRPAGQSPSFYKPAPPRPTATVEAAPPPTYLQRAEDAVRNSVVGRTLHLDPTESESELQRTGDLNSTPDLWPQWAKKPLSLGGDESDAMKNDPAWQAEQTQFKEKAAEFAQKHPTAAAVETGAENAVGGALQSLVTPENIAKGAAAAVVPAVIPAYVGQAASGIPDEVEAGNAARAKGDIKGATQHYIAGGLDAVTAAAMAAGTIAHAGGADIAPDPGRPEPSVEIPREQPQLPAGAQSEYMGEPEAPPQPPGIVDAEVSPWEEAARAQLPAKTTAPANPPGPVNPSTAVDRTTPPTQFAARPQPAPAQGMIVDPQGNALPVRPGLPAPVETAGRKTPIIPKSAPPAETAPTPPQLTSSAVSVPQQPAQTAPDALKPATAEATNQPQPVGAQEPSTGRPIVQATDNPATLQKAAETQAPWLDQQANAAVEGIKGASVTGIRDKKAADDLGEKLNKEGQPAETIPDYLGGRIVVDSPQARDGVAARIRQTMPVIRETDDFEKGGQPYGFRVHTFQVRTPDGNSAELQIVPKEVAEINDETHPQYEAAERARIAGGQNEQQQIASQVRAKHDSAMQAFNQRNQQEAPQQAIGVGSDVTYVTNGGKSRNAKVVRVDGDQAYIRDGYATVKKPIASLEPQGEVIRPRDIPLSETELPNLKTGDNVSYRYPDGSYRTGTVRALGDEHVTIQDNDPKIQTHEIARADVHALNPKPLPSKLSTMKSANIPEAENDDAQDRQQPENQNRAVLSESPEQTQLGNPKPALSPIGPPIPARVDQIKAEVAKGLPVKIYTARAADPQVPVWLEKHGLGGLPVTDVKGPDVGWILDDHSNVKPNSDEPFNIPEIPKGKALYVDLDKTLAYEPGGGTQANAIESGNGGQPRAANEAEGVGKEQPSAIREPEAEGVLQRQPEEDRAGGGGRIQPGEQGNEPARESASEEKPLARAGGGEKPEEVKREPIAGADGKQTTVLTPTRELPAKYRVVEADDLQPSHDAQTFAKTAGYPEGLQERAYDTSKEAQNRVIQQAQNYDPRYTVNTNPDAVNGPPVVTPDGTVLGGNSRAMSTQRLYAGNGDAYKSALKEQAGAFGFKSEQIDAMKKPVLVREIASPETPDEARRIGSELNKSMTGALGVSERAVSAGKNIRPDTLRSVAAMMQADDSTLREAMGKHGGEIVKMLAADGAITDRERPQFVDAKTGGLSEEGKTFVERALMGSVIDDPRLMDAAPKSVMQKLERSLGSITSFASRPDEWNLIPAIRAAVSELGAMQRAGSTVDLWTGQTSLFGGERNPLVDAIMRTLDDKPNTVRKAFDDFARDADQNLPGQARFFTKADAFDAFNTAFGSKLSEQEYHDGLEEAAAKDPNSPEVTDAQSDKGLSQRAEGDATRSGEAGKKADKLSSTVYSGGFLDPELFKTLFPDIAEQFKNWATSDVTPGDEQRETMRQTRGERDRQVASVAKKLQKVRNSWTFRPRADSMKFFNAVESGNISGLSPADERLAQVIQSGFQPLIKEIQGLKPQALQSLIENYFPHIWEQPSMAAKTLRAVMSGRRPFAGSGSFLKQRTIPTMQDGIDMGLKPVSWNPVDLFLRKYAEMGQFLMAHKTLDMMKDSGTAKVVPIGQKAPDGWRQLDDRIGTIYSLDDDDHLYIRGQYYAPPDAARIFNNFVSTGIRGRSAIYDTLRWANDNMNSLQLGISAFHASTTAINAATSEVALAIQQLSQGKPIKAAGHLLSGATVAPSVIRTMVNGSRMMREYLEPGSYRKFAAEASAVAEAGGRAKMDTVSLPAFRKTVNAFRNGAIGEGLLSLPGTMLQSTIAPVMDWMVPRMKLGAFYDMAHNIFDQADRNGWDGDVVRRQMQRAWDSIDNRFGQLVYENLFWHRALQDTLMLASRSVGWNFGDLRELGGAVKDTAQQAAGAFQGKAPEVTPRMAFAMALPLVTGLVGGVLTYLWTGKHPETWKDYFYPKRQDGTRVSIPGYMKDVVSFKEHPINTITNKMSPILEMTAEAINNRDFYGTEIRHKDDPFVKQLLQVARWAGSQTEPFAISGAQKLLGKEGEDTTFQWAHPIDSTERIAKAAAKHPGDVALGQLGFQPAPAAIQNSDALNMARDYGQVNRPSGTRTQEQTDKAKAMHTIEDMYRSGNVNKEVIKSLIDNGTISERDRFHAQMYSRTDPLVRAVKELHPDQALNVYLAATPAEQKELRPAIETKQREIMNDTPREQQAALKKAYHDALNPQPRFTKTFQASRSGATPPTG